MTDSQDVLTRARVAAADRSTFLLLGPGEPVLAVLPGRWRYSGFGALGLPVVGDWVTVREEGTSRVIEAIEPRTSMFLRKAGGRSSAAQPVAANVDVVLVVTDVDHDFNPRRLERYASAAIAGGARPVVVLNKSDLPHDADSLLDETRNAIPGIEAIFTSATAEDGLATLEPVLEPGSTVAFVGSSGVGKSSLTNRILGDARQETREVRGSDGKGRHVTSRRELMVAPSGVCVIDTPGMREMGVYEAGAGVAEVFADVLEVAAGCRYRDCSHTGEPGCALLQAVDQGILVRERVESFLRLQDEIARNESRAAERASSNAKGRWKSIHKEARRMRRLHGKLGLKDR